MVVVGAGAAAALVDTVEAVAPEAPLVLAAATAWLLTPWVAMPAVRPPKVSTLAATDASLRRWRRRWARAMDCFLAATRSLAAPTAASS